MDDEVEKKETEEQRMKKEDIISKSQEKQTRGRDRTAHKVK